MRRILALAAIAAALCAVIAGTANGRVDAHAASLPHTTVTGPTWSLYFGCIGYANLVCKGRATLTTRERSQGGRVIGLAAGVASPPVVTSRVVVGGASYAIRAGHNAHVAITLNAMGRRLLRRFRRLTATVTFSDSQLPRQLVTFVSRG
jgi:hypothetical protein